MKKLLLTAVVASLLATSASAQNAFTTAMVASIAPATNGWGDKKTPFFDKVAGKFNATATIGYVYNFAGTWDNVSIAGKANSAFGGGVRLGWLSKTNFGLSADYLGFASKWNSIGVDYTNNQHIITFTPSYRFSFGKNKEWGLKLAMGVGFSLGDLASKAATTSANGTATKVAGGASYYSQSGAGALKSGCGSSNVSNIRYYGDSIGGATTTGVAVAANSCQEALYANPVADGLSDAAIAALFNPNTGTDVNAVGTPNAANQLTWVNGRISYGVWRRLFATESAKMGEFAGRDLETRADYITRCTTQQVGSCEGQAATAAGAYAAANVVAPPSAEERSAGKAKTGFVFAPEITAEYDNGLWHGEFSFRYIHELLDVKYIGQNGAKDLVKTAGPLALFIGAGFGVNF